MAETPVNIEPSTMNYIFEMFGKSVTQMLQASLNQQVAIDELRAQVRSCQAQITNITNTMEEFEDRMLVKLQEMRPVIYTRDGLPLDDALEIVQNKLTQVSEKSSNYDETITRLQEEVSGKLDTERFEAVYRSTEDATESFQDATMTIEALQKELVKQRTDMDNMMERCTQMVTLQIEQIRMHAENGEGLASSRGFNAADSTEYITKAQFKEALLKLKTAEFDPDALFDAADLQESVRRLKKAENDLDADYSDKKSRIKNNLSRAMRMLGDGEEDGYEYDDYVEFESEFEFEFDENEERELRDVGIDANPDADVAIGETCTRTMETTGQRRNISVSCELDGGERKKTRREQSVEDSNAFDEVGGSGSVDEKKLSAKISNAVMGRVENLIIDMLSTTGVGGVKLDKADAKALVQQLSVLQNLKEGVDKLKALIHLKMDKVEAEQELSIRITREEFFSMLSTIFPSNQALQKALANFKKKLPPLKKPETASKGRGEEEGHYNIHKRQIQTASPNLVPARNSRLLALNQKFLKGADGKYYLRDIGGDNGVQTPNPATGARSGVTADQAFDFQPFLPASAMKEPAERITVPMEHRAKTPRDAND